jgi:hypothetical protein
LGSRPNVPVHAAASVYAALVGAGTGGADILRADGHMEDVAEQPGLIEKALTPRPPAP